MASSPPLSRRAKILMNLQSQLQTITTANGYSRDVQTVTTNVKPWSATPEAETPVIYIIDEKTEYRYHAGKLTDRSWIVGLFLVMKNKTQLDLEEMIADIETCLFKNSRLAFPATITLNNPSGAVASHMRVLEIITDNQLFSEIEGAQLAKLSIEIIYTACVDSVR